MSKNKETRLSGENTSGAEVLDRREAMARLGKLALYTAPATQILLLSERASAQSAAAAGGGLPPPPP